MVGALGTVHLGTACTDHKDQTKSASDEIRRIIITPKVIRALDFSRFGKALAAEDRSERGIAGHVENVCEFLAHPFLYFPLVNAKE